MTDKSNASGDLLGAISAHVRDGGVRIVDDDKCYIDMIESGFPFVGSRIDWGQLGDVRFEVMESKDSFSKQCFDFLLSVRTSRSISDSEEVVVLGDSCMEYAVVTSVRKLIDIIEDIVDLPQHTYVVESQGCWCMVFTMEGEMAFGVSR